MVMLRSVELFTGSGGLALGITRAGFRHELLVEIDKHARATLEQNREHLPEVRDWPLGILRDVSDVDYGPYEDRIDLLAAGTPCQPFSLGGKHQGDRDERNMFPQVFRATRELRPRAILLENVRGLMRKAVKPYFDYILRQLALPQRQPREGEGWQEHDARLRRALEVGVDSTREPFSYDVRYEVLNAADFGVPQRRERIFIMAFRRDLGATRLTSVPTHSGDALLYAQYVDGSYWQRHDLPPKPTPDRLTSRVSRIARSAPPRESGWRTVRDALADFPEPIDLQEHSAFFNHAGNPGARAFVGHTGSPMDEPAKTLKAGVHGVPGVARTCCAAPMEQSGTSRRGKPRAFRRSRTCTGFSGPLE